MTESLLFQFDQVGSVVEANAGPAASIKEYDVVIVGGGTAGCVLASRLSELSNITVLVLEAGGSGVANPSSRVPAGLTTLFKSEVDYNLYTVEQPNAAVRARYWPRGKMLGGCSSINAMMYHHCAPSDYDEWAKGGEEGASEWSYENLKPYFMKFERYSPSKEHPRVDLSFRGSSGPVEVGYHSHFGKICKAFNVACENAGLEYKPDVNTPAGTLGVTKIMTFVDSKGQRVSMESAYLTPEVLTRPNLKVATGAHVTKLLFDAAQGKPRAVGVEFVGSKDGTRFQVRARKEVVLCAGAIHTPHILLLSGIGPAEQLAANSIPIVEDLPGVGAHLMDHPVAFAQFKTTERTSLNYLRGRNDSERALLEEAQKEYAQFGTGPFSTNAGECAAFLRSTDRKLFPVADYPKELEDSTSASNAPDIELMAAPMTFYEHGLGEIGMGDMATLAAVLVRPTSKGTIKLRSADPFEQPAIDPNYLATEHDLDVLTRGLQYALRVARTEPYASCVDTSATATADPFFDHNLLDQPLPVVQEEVRKRLETIYHPSCTARMAPLAEGGVVDCALRVHGVEGLRVVDCSIFPTIPSGHTSAPVIAVAEKAADMMKKQYAT